MGTDVSLDQCPPKAWLASNVSLQTWSIFDEPPDNLIGRFDLVHLRFLNFVIKDNELTSTLLRVMKTLSEFFLIRYCSTYLLQHPRRLFALTRFRTENGGWIQWGEYDHLSNTTVKADSEASSSNFETLQARLRQGLTRPR